MGVQVLRGKRKFGGGKGRPIAKYRDTVVIYAKTAEQIEMLFRLWACMGCRNHVRWGSSSRGAEGRCHGTNFGTQFAITGFVGYNFGCMIASGTLFDSRGVLLESSYLMKTYPRLCV